MSPETRKKAHGILKNVLDLRPEDRDRAIDTLCGGDEELREYVDRLLGYETLAESVVRTANPEDLLGETFGPYRLRKVLGVGGMAWVYRAERTAPYIKDVALKVSKPCLDSNVLAARFERERQVLGRLAHPSIATIFDAGVTESGLHYFVMEFIGGGTLTEYCDREQLDLRARLQLFARVCDAIHHAHQNTIMHRDLKPGNILVAATPDGPQPKIIDFGLAKPIFTSPADVTAVTESGQLLGTISYMSPEQADTGDSLDIRTDVYSLGVILYELLTGTLPHGDGARSDLMAGLRAIREEDPRSPAVALRELGEAVNEIAKKRRLKPHSLAKAVRGDFTRIVFKALEKNRLRRYASADALAGDIRRSLANEPISVRAPETLYVLSKFLRRNRIAVLGVLALVLLVVAFNGYSVARRLYDSASLRSEGHALLTRYQDARSQLSDLKKTLAAIRAETKEWAPLWERTKEIETAKKLQRTGRDLPALIADAILKGQQARQVAPSVFSERDRVNQFLLEAYTIQRKDSERGDLAGPRPDYFEDVMRFLRRESAAPEPPRLERITLRSDPPGAAVYCFRYIDFSTLLLPLPYHPEREGGSGEKPSGLVIGKIPGTNRESRDLPFQPGDRITKIDGEPVHWIGDLAAHIRRSPKVLQGELDRSGTTAAFVWKDPIPSAVDEGLRTEHGVDLGENRLVHPFLQTGVIFDGYPLSCAKDNLVGTARPDRALRLTLPPGDYLLVFRLLGHADVRYPVAIPLAEQVADVTVRLPKHDEVPPGFVYVPEGHVALGGDVTKAFQSFDWGYRRVEAFFIGELEVTFGEWRAFLNAADIKGRIDKEGRLDGVLVVPQINGELKLERSAADSTWQFPTDSGTPWRDDWPVLAVNYQAAENYARWRTERSNRWRYRLPTSFEWERAARGVDRRSFTWGNYMVWSNCWSVRGNFTKLPGTVGTSPFDESPFGVRDMNGSVSELTNDRPVDYARKRIAYRGGSWDYEDEHLYFRLVSRNTILETEPHRAIGFRLVAQRKTGEADGE